MHDCIDSLRGLIAFSTKVVNSVYWQTKIDDYDRIKTAFTSHYYLYRFTRILFRLEIALENFKRAMDINVTSVRCQLDSVCLDDILFFSKFVIDDIRQADRLLRLRFKARVNLNLKLLKILAEEMN